MGVLCIDIHYMQSQSPYVSASQALRLVESGQRVYVQGSVSIPEVLLDALTARGPVLRGVEVVSAFAVGRRDAPYATSALRDAFLPVSLFVSNSVRKAVGRGEATVVPVLLSEGPALMRRGPLRPDVALINCSLPNADGVCSYGISADLAVAAVETAKTVIAQVNRHVPFCCGDALIRLDDVAAAVRADDPLVEVPTSIPTEEDIAIGRHIAELVPDGATIQIGVGGIPNATLAALADHQHLGLHTEALTDGLLPLLRSGVIDNSRKKIMPGKSVASLALGSRALYDFLDGNHDIALRDVAWTNDPYVIRQNPDVMAINSAIEVDLTGQVCADSIGERIFSGVGGQHDFMCGGAMSEGGKTFIAMTSRSFGGNSKIVPTLQKGAGVVSTRAQVNYIVTEYGAADLRGRDMAARARLLIGIAHPSAREALEKEACRRFGYRFLRMR